MDDLLRQIQTFFESASTFTILLAAGLSGAIETIFPPFPSEGVLLLASFAGARRHLSPWTIIVVSALGSFASLYALYLVGRGPLRNRMKRLLERWIGKAEKSVKSFFDRWGYGAVLVSRFLPAIRGPLAFLAGVYHLKPLPTGAALLAGCFLWNGLVVFLGYRTGRVWDGSTGGLMWAGLALAGATLFLWFLGAGLYRLVRK